MAGVPVSGTSASILQYTSFGETWYRGFMLSLTKRFEERYQFRASYTLSKAEDDSTDYQSAFIPENTGRGRDRDNPAGLPIGFNPMHEKGPSLQDQRHRLVISGVCSATWQRSPCIHHFGGLGPAVQHPRRGGPQWRRQWGNVPSRSSATHSR